MRCGFRIEDRGELLFARRRVDDRLVTDRLDQVDHDSNFVLTAVRGEVFRADSDDDSPSEFEWNRERKRKRWRAEHRPGNRRLKNVHRRRSDELRDERIRRLFVDLARRTHLLDFAGAHHGDALSHRHRLDLVVRDIHGSGAELLLQLRDLAACLNAQFRVEVRQRLVEKKDGRLTNDRAADGDPLTLAAGKLLRLSLEHGSEAENFGGEADAPLDFGGGDRAHAQPELHVLPHGHVRIERVALEDHRDVSILWGEVIHDAAADGDGAFRDFLETGDHPQRRRFAATRWTNEHHQLMVFDVEIEVLDDRNVSITLAHRAERDVRHAGVRLHRFDPLPARWTCSSNTAAMPRRCASYALVWVDWASARGPLSSAAVRSVARRATRGKTLILLGDSLAQARADNLAELDHGAVRDRAVHGVALLTPGDEAGIVKDLDVLAHTGLAGPQFFREYADALLAAIERLDHSQTKGFSHDFETRGHQGDRCRTQVKLLAHTHLKPSPRPGYSADPCIVLIWA